MKEKQRSNRYQYEKSGDHANESPPTRNYFIIVFIVLNGKDKDPNCLTDIESTIERHRYEQPYEITVIYSPNAIIQKFAMMIEILNTAMAGVAVVARLMDQMFALFTISNQLMCLQFVVFIEQQPVDRVRAGQIEIIQNSEDQKSVTDAK